MTCPPAAQRVGVNVETLRYERRGLIRAARADQAA